jgi:hypothetical protein
LLDDRVCFRTGMVADRASLEDARRGVWRTAKDLLQLRYNHLQKGVELKALPGGLAQPDVWELGELRE